ncbi:PEP-CTERM sorting domain-containing protein [Lacipirellula parvula]|uniref:Ice-binding protein C-terminal domain-containing protein n=1 Tax=Lacipirellula parvula TaxID=2650471 RepID=A0A5K7XEU2_9BACT|nr:PEP-CTERM sorting domain-containing protein [Lacipirellula parvula]BBO34905.1 hypothetical protein PLANPX_4517 [Lacipirellula parvula]
MIRRFALALIACAAIFAVANVGLANTLFTDQAVPSTGSFEWDNFVVTTNAVSDYSASHAPNLSSGVGAATVKGGVVPPPTFAPPAQVATGSLYTGSSKGRFTTSLTGASTTDANTTIVLQIAFDSAGNNSITNSTLLLNSTAPTEFVDRGVASGFHYYWAEWQLPAAAAYTALFDTAANHSALAGVQLDYYNGAATFNAVAPAIVPEPATLAMAGLGLVGFAALRRRIAA